MKTIKKFWKYFLNFIILFLLVTVLTHYGTKINNKKEEERVEKIEYITQKESPKIELTKSTAKKIIGTATNDTNILIDNIYIKADFYDDEDKLLGTKYYEIKYFNVGEKAKFEIEYKFKDVARIEITATENK